MHSFPKPSSSRTKPQAAGSSATSPVASTRTTPKAAPLLAELPILLRNTLPDYMIPAVLVVLESLPKTANGKLDRKALPQGSGSPTTSRPFTAPTTEAQTRLAAIYTEVLSLPAVSVTDSIFELGADSLDIFRIAARAQREGLAITATQIFQNRTILGICNVLQHNKNAASPRVATRITPASRKKYKVRADA